MVQGSPLGIIHFEKLDQSAVFPFKNIVMDFSYMWFAEIKPGVQLFIKNEIQVGKVLMHSLTFQKLIK